MDRIDFPIDPCKIISTYENCRVMTYQQVAEINHCSLEEVILLCESKSGCTHYDIARDRYLILWNDDGANYNVPGRQLWTKAHELGHVVLKHLPPSATRMMAENSFNNLTERSCELEADQFACTLLCPMPLFELLKIKTPTDITYVFGLSTEASNYRWEEYEKWRRFHKKTAYESDLRKLFLDRKKNGKVSYSPLRSSNVCFHPGYPYGRIDFWKDEDEDEL